MSEPSNDEARLTAVRLLEDTLRTLHVYPRSFHSYGISVSQDNPQLMTVAFTTVIDNNESGICGTVRRGRH